MIENILNEFGGGVIKKKKKNQNECENLWGKALLQLQLLAHNLHICRNLEYAINSTLPIKNLEFKYLIFTD